MSGPEPDRRLVFLRNVLHPSLAVWVPLSFFILATELARCVVRIPLSPFAYLFVLLAGIEGVVTGNVLFEERLGSFDRIREPFYLLAVVGLALLVFERGPLLERPARLLRPEIVYLGALVLLEWVICWRIHNGLRDRELLEAAFETRQGASLQSALRDNSELARAAIAAVPQVKQTIFVFQVLAFAAVIALFAAGVRIPTATTVLFLLHAVGGVVAIAVLNNAAEDQLLSAEGVSLTPFYRRRRQIYVLAILATAVVAVALYARSSSLLPLDLFEPLLAWLARLFDRKRELRPYRPPTPGMGRPELDLLRQLRLDSSGPSPLLELLRFLLRVIWNVIRLLLLALLAYFLIAPLVSPTLRRRVRALRPLAFVREQLRRLMRALSEMLRDIAAWLRRPAGARARAKTGRRRSWHRRLRFQRRGLFKRWEMGTVLRAYVRLLRWGERQGVRFRAPIAPREYLGLVARVRPECAAELGEAGQILEESLYSPRRAGRDRIQRYLRIVKELVRSRA